MGFKMIFILFSESQFFHKNSRYNEILIKRQVLSLLFRKEALLSISFFQGSYAHTAIFITFAFEAHRPWSK